MAGIRSVRHCTRFGHVGARLQLAVSLDAWTVIKSRLGDSPDFDLPIPGEAGRCPAGEESGDFRDKVRVEADNQKREPEENSGTGRTRAVPSLRALASQRYGWIARGTRSRTNRRRRNRRRWL